MISEEEFSNLTRLARLDGKDKSLSGMRDDFNKILEYVEKIRELDTSSVTDYYTAIDTRNVIREDKAGAVLSPAEIAGIAPQWEQDCFVVPPVIEAD